MNQERFKQAIEETRRQSVRDNGIGTLGEKTLHSVIKRYMEPLTDNHEIKIGSYIADIVGENGIIEIQTRNFAKLRKKLDVFLSVARVTVVYPIPHRRWVSWIDTKTGEVSGKRKSPKTGSFYHVFSELYWIKEQLTHPNLTILLLLTDTQDIRELNGWGKDKKRGSSRHERIPLELIDELSVGGDAGYAALVPAELPDEFTSNDFKLAARINLRDAQTALNVLNYVGAIEHTGRSGRLKVYRRV